MLSSLFQAPLEKLKSIIMFDVSQHTSKINTVDALLMHPFFQGRGTKPCQARIKTSTCFTACSVRTRDYVLLDPDIDPDGKTAICPYHKTLYEKKADSWFGFFDN
jgi:hypothetical protein